MRVVIEIPDDKSGTGIYVRELVARLRTVEVPGTDEPIEVIAAEYRRLSHERFGRHLSRFLNSFRMVWWMQVTLPRICRRARADVLHCTAFVCPRFAPCPVVVTIHDMTHARYPETMDAIWRYYLHLFLRPSLKRADRLLAISHFSASDLITVHPEVRDKVTVVHEAAAKAFCPAHDPAAAARRLDKLGVRLPYFLHVGTMNPRKNIEGLLRGFARFKETSGEASHRLIIAGARGWLCAGIIALVERLAARDQLLFTGRVDDEDLIALYQGAEALVMPSFYEGFGLPVLEAMACGCPVITSNVSSLPEIAGDAALLVDSNDEEAMAQAMSAICSNPALRQSLVEKGCRRAAEFSWDRAAAETAQVYADAMAMYDKRKRKEVSPP
jgi:glycosyltransferase involved in cell wall biosynthesis